MKLDGQINNLIVSLILTFGVTVGADKESLVGVLAVGFDSHLTSSTRVHFLFFGDDCLRLTHAFRFRKLFPLEICFIFIIKINHNISCLCYINVHYILDVVLPIENNIFM